MELQDRIKRIGVKKQFLAMRVNVTPYHFSHWLAGRRDLTDYEVNEIEKIIHDIEVALHLDSL